MKAKGKSVYLTVEQAEVLDVALSVLEEGMDSDSPIALRDAPIIEALRIKLIAVGADQ